MYLLLENEYYLVQKALFHKMYVLSEQLKKLKKIEEMKIEEIFHKN